MNSQLISNLYFIFRNINRDREKQRQRERSAEREKERERIAPRALTSHNADTSTKMVPSCTI